MNSIKTLAGAAALAAVVATMAPSVNAAPAPSIEDPLQDGNFVNDQGLGDGSVGDFNQAGADGSTVGDLVSVTFTNDKKNLYVHVETEAAPPAIVGESFRVRTNPDGPGGTYCLNFEMFFPGANNAITAFEGHLRDACTNEVIEATVSPSLLGGTMLTIARSAHEGLGKGAMLTAPQAQTMAWSGSSYPAGAAGPYIDTTKPGTDYKLKK